MADAAKWRFSTSTPLAYQGNGGPDGSGYVSRTLAFSTLTNPNAESTLLFRAQDEFGSSDGRFAGDWLAAGVVRVEAFVRHNAPEPMVFRARFSSVDNFPGASPILTTATPAGAWTKITFDVDPASQQYSQVPDQFEGSSFAEIFREIGHVQIGVGIQPSLRGSTTSITFDLDQVRVFAVAEPSGSLAAIGFVLACLQRRRRGTR